MSTFYAPLEGRQQEIKQQQRNSQSVSNNRAATEYHHYLQDF